MSFKNEAKPLEKSKPKAVGFYKAQLIIFYALNCLLPLSAQKKSTENEFELVN